MMEDSNYNDIFSVSPSAMEQSGIEKEGWALKRTNRARRGFNKRYFVLRGNVLSYYLKPNDVEPRGEFDINESSCTISDVFIQEWKKHGPEDVLYCVKLKFSPQEPSSSGTAAPTTAEGEQQPQQEMETIMELPASPKIRRSYSRSDDSSRSVDSDPGTPTKLYSNRREEGMLTPTSSNSKIPISSSDSHNPSPDRYRSPPRRSIADNDNGLVHENDEPQSGIKSILRSKERGGSRLRRSSKDGTADNLDGTASKEKQNIKKRSTWHGTTPLLQQQADLADQDHDHDNSGPPLPPLSPIPSFDRNDVITTPQNQGQQKEADDQDNELYASYLAKKKKKKKNRKKKVIKGTKIAAAAGATVTAGVLTAGVGLLAGGLFVVLGAAAGGTGVAAEKRLKRKQNKAKEMIIAFDSLENAKRWVAALNNCIESELVKDSTWGQLFALGGRNTTTLLVPTDVAKTTVKSNKNYAAVDSPINSGERGNALLMAESSTSESNIQWQPLDVGWATWMGASARGIRLFREGKITPSAFSARSLLGGRPCLPHKAQLVLNASPLNAFLCLMSHNRSASTANDVTMPNTGQRASFRVIQPVDDHADIIHLVFRPLYLFPSWTVARDFLLYRYWRLDDDGSYVICYDSVTHENCPPVPGFVRGVFHGVYTIAPPKVRPGKKSGGSGKLMDVREECLLTALVQIDPRGWVPNVSLPFLSNQGHGEAFTVAALLQILDIQDALDQERFVSTNPPAQTLIQPVPAYTTAIMQSAKESDQIDGASLASLSLAAYADPICQAGAIETINSSNYDYTYSKRESTASLDSLQGFASQPPSLPLEYWAEPDHNIFFVRGKNYLTDRKKVHSGPNIGQLVAVDVVRVEKAILSGLCTHPSERMQQALERERRLLEEGFHSDLAPYFFVLNISIPGYHMVFYFAVDDMSRIDGTDGTPESKLAKEFFFGSSDKMRDATFKLIPQIVVGNFLVRRAVGTTPCIMGKALKQLYVRGDRFFEVILDCGSSAVATGAVRLSLTYAETMVVDLGFLFEGNDETTLPERLFGCVRMKHVPFGSQRRFVEQPPLASTKTE